MTLKKIATASCLILLVAASVGAVFWLLRNEPAATEAGEAQNVLAAWLKEAEPFFPRAPSTKPITLPQDHGPHPDAPLEVWECSGVLTNPEGRQFGFQWSLFRLGLRPDKPQRKSAWAANEVYRGLFTLSDEAGGRFRWYERFGRAALGLAGSEASPQRIWLENWAMTVSPAGMFELTAAADDISLKLRLDKLKPPVLPDDGLMGQGGGRLRVYFFSRLQAAGGVRINGVTHAVQGSAWLGHLWGRLLPPGGQTALNRYQIRLDDGREIVAFQLHRRDASAEPINSGFWIEKDGSTKTIRRDDLRVEATAYWTSRATGARYPVRWRILLPIEHLELNLRPLLEDQEIKGARRSWSGAVRVAGGTEGGERVSGSGFVDLTGY